MQAPHTFGDILNKKYKLKLKGVGPIGYHLGCGYKSDEDGTLVADPSNRILTGLTANPPGVWPQNTPSRWGKPGAQLVGFEKATPKNTLKIGKNT